MGYKNLKACVDDLKTNGDLKVIDTEIDPHLELGMIQRRAYLKKAPALLFTKVKGTKFPMLANLFGTKKRCEFLFRDSLDSLQKVFSLKVDPSDAFKKPWKYLKVPRLAFHLLPKKVKKGPITQCQTTIDQLPALQSWPMDGGPYITLPQVYSESVTNPGWQKSNLGMYRVQLSGNNYKTNQEVGLHYQIHRGIGVHHQEALKKGLPFKVNIFVGGPPSLTVAAVMPLPEGLPELSFAGALGGRRLKIVTQKNELPIPAEADFCISGTVLPGTLPEGPFGDHLGYYSLKHDFPVLRVDKVYHRPDAIWPFTTVGRPPQEDTTFGEFIHDLTGPVIPSVIPGVHAVHAVDATGVHPLLLAIGSERYTPYSKEHHPQELLTQANAILGQGQLSLAKYLLIINKDDNPELDIHSIDAFLIHLLERIDFKRDLHFQTKTTIDTLDYSGEKINQGSKLVMAACGPQIRSLAKEIPSDLNLPEPFSNPKICLPGILAIKSPKHHGDSDKELKRFCDFYKKENSINQFPMILLVDDSEFTAESINNMLWVCFTRSNPSHDISGIEPYIENKHWGCLGSMVIDARTKPHHAPELKENEKLSKKTNKNLLLNF